MTASEFSFAPGANLPLGVKAILSDTSAAASGVKE